MMVGCPECGVAQRISQLPRGAMAECSRCETALERTAGRSAGAALALALAALLLFIPGNMLPAMRSNLLGGSIEARAIDSVGAFVGRRLAGRGRVRRHVRHHRPIAARGMLVVVLGILQAGHSASPGRGRLFRLAQALRGWTMAEVFVVAGAVTYSRVAAQLDVELLPGGWCFIRRRLLLLRPRRRWTGGASGTAIVPGRARRRRRGEAVVSCISLPDGRRSSARRGLPALRPGGCASAGAIDERTAALTLASLFLLYPAYFLPMTSAMQPNGVMERTIMDGVEELFQPRLLVSRRASSSSSASASRSASCCVLRWLTLSVHFPHRMGLRLARAGSTGRRRDQSLVVPRPFIVALNALDDGLSGRRLGRAGAGALAFALVVVLTMIASRMFDRG